MSKWPGTVKKGVNKNQPKSPLGSAWHFSPTQRFRRTKNQWLSAQYSSRPIRFKEQCRGKNHEPWKHMDIEDHGVGQVKANTSQIRNNSRSLKKQERHNREIKKQPMRETNASVTFDRYATIHDSNARWLAMVSECEQSNASFVSSKSFQVSNLFQVMSCY